jgi:RNA polymerase sigma-70 factor, ECF subfamily
MEPLVIVPQMGSGAEALPVEIHAAILRARTAWPLIALDEAGFVRRLLEILGEQPAAAVAALHVEDLYLAWACTEGHEEALMTFDARMLPVVEAALARARIEPGTRDDLVQELRVHLLVGSGGGPGKLAQYRGQAEIERWLRATALRAAYRVASKSRRDLAFEDTAWTAASVLDDDPVLAQWKDHCRGELKRALAAALAGLPRRDRLLLKQHYLDRLTIEDVAALHKIHRSSAARWLAQARAALAEAVLGDFRRRLRVTETEVQSIVQLVRSQLDITLDRFLSAG